MPNSSSFSFAPDVFNNVSSKSPVILTSREPSVLLITEKPRLFFNDATSSNLIKDPLGAINFNCAKLSFSISSLGNFILTVTSSSPLAKRLTIAPSRADLTCAPISKVLKPNDFPLDVSSICISSAP